MTEFALRRQWGPVPRYERVKYYDGRQPFITIAGPCSVESEDQINTLSDIVAANGATHLRGGVFRAGTYAGDNFGWVDRELIKAYHEAANRNGLKNIIEVLDIHDTEFLEWNVFPFADCLQIGARQMQNYTLLKVAAQTGKTIFLKRHPGSTLDEWLGSAEYILKYGGYPVLIERGSSTHATHVRWDLSISMIPAVHAINPNMPIVVDGSHGTGRRDLVPSMTLAGVAAGANGCLVEVHTDPKNSLSDADQAIDPTTFQQLMNQVRGFRKALAVTSVIYSEVY